MTGNLIDNAVTDAATRVLGAERLGRCAAVISNLEITLPAGAAVYNLATVEIAMTLIPPSVLDELNAVVGEEHDAEWYAQRIVAAYVLARAETRGDE